MDKRLEIYKQLVMLSVAMGTEQKPERLIFYANALEEYDFGKVSKAIAKLARANKFFPQLAEIIDAIKGPEIPTDEMAIQISNEIIESISQFGRYQEAEASKALGVKFGIVERFGGWQMLCSIENDEIGTVRAQLRELAKAYINKSKRECVELGIEFSLNANPIQIAAREKKPNLQLVDFNFLSDITLIE